MFSLKFENLSRISMTGQESNDFKDFFKDVVTLLYSKSFIKLLANTGLLFVCNGYH